MRLPLKSAFQYFIAPKTQSESEATPQMNRFKPAAPPLWPNHPLLLLFAAASCLLSPIALHSAARLEPYARIQNPDVRECSGIVKSGQREDTYWVHNDSGSGPQLYAIRRDGSHLATIETPFSSVDWEDIATDSLGNLYIGDFGNNANTRKDLAIHRISEPDPDRPNAKRSTETFPFRYAEQTRFPPPKRIFDCESLFWTDGKLYLLTKSLGDISTRLYRFNTLDADTTNLPELIGSFEIGPRVTAADLSPDGKQLAVLTTRSVWIFERPEHSDNFLDGNARALQIRAGQCEAICWDGPDRLIIANEGSYLYELDPDILEPADY